jgi:hypothetical protein
VCQPLLAEIDPEVVQKDREVLEDEEEHQDKL